MNIVVVGAALAGGRAATALRAEGHDGPITLVGAESHRPYERPPLSKGFLTGSAELDSVFVHPEAWYAENDVELRSRWNGRVRSGKTTAMFSVSARSL